jgi:predicted RNase H-like nuclease (RuvC/YqgF family)
LREKKAVA